MSACDLCGKESNLHTAVIESSTLSVCDSCSSYGKIISRYQEPKKTVKKEVLFREKPEETIVPNYHELLKSSREKMKLDLKEISQKIGIKESLISKLEAGLLPLDFSMAKRFETFYQIKLITKGEKFDYVPTKTKDMPLTLGDLLKKKLEK